MHTKSVAALLCAVLWLANAPAWATPVARTRAERELYGRTFLEPAASYDYIQFGEGGHGEFEWGFELLEKLFGRYVEITTVADELGDPDAVSVGADGLPPWHPQDDGDGLPLHVVVVTDRKVPDSNKRYVVLTAGHSGEPCGREGSARFLEDLIVAAAEGSDERFDNAAGARGEQASLTARQILARTKIFFISPSPDGWRAGDGYGNQHSQYNGAGINSNRLAYTDGWVFPPDPTLYLKGYTTMTQPEGIAMTRYLTEIRRKELQGKPFAIGMDMHGPLPFGFILLHDEGSDPVKLERMVDLGLRVKQNMEETVAAFGPADSALDTLLYAARDQLPDDRRLGTIDNDAWRLQAWARWGFVTHIVDSLGYTATGSWGGFFASDSGLDAVSLSYEINCRPSSPWVGADQQIYADNVRQVLETGVVSAAAWDELPPPRVELGGRIGFYEPGVRVTDADGNPSPPPRHHPGGALRGGPIEQVPYDVSNTDYFRDLTALTGRRLDEVRPHELRPALDRLDRFVVADALIGDTAALARFVERGGELVLTDSALKMLPALAGIPRDSVVRDHAYVGYADLDRSHPLTHGLLATAWQTYAPPPLGFPLLMERDGYWSEDDNPETDDSSPTRNSAPIFSVARDAWEEAGGVTIGTADPPADRKAVEEGSMQVVGKRDAAQDKTVIGILRRGRGRIVIFGALLPRPTERFPHWFGLNAYALSHAGQTMLLRALGGNL